MKSGRLGMILCIIADDHKLPPYIILSWRMIPKREMFPRDVTVRTQKWLDGSWFLEGWVKNVCEICPGALIIHRECQGLMYPQKVSRTNVLDTFCGYSSDLPLVRLKTWWHDQLTPATWSYGHEPFHVYVRKKHEASLLSEILALITSGKIKRATAAILAKWVLEGGWRKSEIVIQGMLHYKQTSCTKDGILRDSSLWLSWFKMWLGRIWRIWVGDCTCKWKRQ